MREVPRELGEGFAVYSAELKRAAKSGFTCMGTIDPNETIVTGCFRGRKRIRLGCYIPGFMAGSTRIRGYLLLIDRQ